MSAVSSFVRLRIPSCQSQRALQGRERPCAGSDRGSPLKRTADDGTVRRELSEFLKQALEVTRHLSEGWAEMLERRRDYIEEGRVSEAERDQAEADMVMFIKVLADKGG